MYAITRSLDSHLRIAGTKSSQESITDIPFSSIQDYSQETNRAVMIKDAVEILDDPTNIKGGYLATHVLLHRLTQIILSR